MAAYSTFPPQPSFGYHGMPSYPPVSYNDYPQGGSLFPEALPPARYPAHKVTVYTNSFPEAPQEMPSFYFSSPHQNPSFIPSDAYFAAEPQSYASAPFPNSCHESHWQTTPAGAPVEQRGYARNPAPSFTAPVVTYPPPFSHHPPSTPYHTDRAGHTLPLFGPQPTYEGQQVPDIPHSNSSPIRASAVSTSREGVEPPSCHKILERSSPNSLSSVPDSHAKLRAHTVPTSGRLATHGGLRVPTPEPSASPICASPVSMTASELQSAPPPAPAPIYLVKRKVNVVLRAVAKVVHDDGTHWALEVRGKHYHIEGKKGSVRLIEQNIPESLLIELPELKEAEGSLREAIRRSHSCSLLMWKPDEGSVDKRRKRIGETLRSDEEIKAICDTIVESNGTYRILANNCRHFVFDLLWRISNHTPEHVRETLGKEVEVKNLETIRAKLTGWLENMEQPHEWKLPARATTV